VFFWNQKSKWPIKKNIYGHEAVPCKCKNSLKNAFFAWFWAYIRWTASQPNRFSHINVLHINQSYWPKDQSMKFGQILLGIKDGSKFWWLPWFPAKNQPSQTFLPPVYPIIIVVRNALIWGRKQLCQNFENSLKSMYFSQQLIWSLVKMFLNPVWEGKMHGVTKIGVFRPLFCVGMLGKSTNYSTGTRPLCSTFWAK